MSPFARTRLGSTLLGVVCAVLCALVSPPAHAQALNTTEEATPRELRSVKVDEHLDQQVPKDAILHDLDGKAVRLGDLFDGKRPTLLTFAYYNCPVLCSLILNSVVDSLSKVGWTIGKEFDVVTISIDPHESVEKAKSKRESLITQYNRPGADKGWHFLLGDEATIARVTDAVGYRFHYDEEQKQFAHPATLVLLKPDGKVARYLYGIEYPPNDVRLGLLEASEGKSIGTVDQVILFCYRYDPHQGKYIVLATRVMQLGGVLTALGFGGFLAGFWLRERRRRRAAERATDEQSTNVAAENAPPPGRVRESHT